MAGRPRKRDLKALAARLDKHVDRLPEYAERAQKKWQRYRPAEQRGYPERRQPSGGKPAVRPAGNLPMKLPDLNVVADVRDQLVRWNAPQAKLARRRRRTSRFMTMWILLTILCGISVVLGALSAVSVTTLLASVLMPAAGTLVFGTFAVRSGLRLRTLNRAQLPAAASPAALPSPSSTTYEPLRWLARAENTLADLMTQMSAPVGNTPGMPPDTVAEARQASGEAASALRSLATRIQAIERARDTSPVAERNALDAAVRTLREQLDEGLEEFGGLVAAAGKAVAASSAGGVDGPKRALTDATDRLAGMAIALRELS